MRVGSIALLATGCLGQLPQVADPCAMWEEPGLYRFKLDREDSRDRKPYVYVPASAGPRDLVVLLHGTGMNGPKMSDATNFAAGADAFGFVLVYPNGLGWPFKYWNAGTTADGPADDVAFLEALVEALSPQVCGEQVLGVGFSAGGMMAHRWGCEGQQIDAVASVAGPLMVDGCDGEPRPVRHYHGTADSVVPVDGGPGDTTWTLDFRSADDTMDAWRTRNQCATTEPSVEVNGDTTCSAWSCAASTELCLVEGWGHRWPGGINATQTDANATQAIWDWFQASVADPP